MHLHRHVDGAAETHRIIVSIIILHVQMELEQKRNVLSQHKLFG